MNKRELECHTRIVSSLQEAFAEIPLGFLDTLKRTKNAFQSRNWNTAVIQLNILNEVWPKAANLRDDIISYAVGKY